MKIVTGVGEGPHVTSKEMRRIIECMSGQDSYIIDCGEQLKPELVSNNLLKIRSGAMVHHGNVSSVDPYDEIEITNGTQGMKRIDLIVNRYTKNAETQIETNKWVVIQGMPAETNPVVPKHTIGKLQDGDLVDDCPYIQITLDGINVTEVKQLLKVMPNIPDLVAENAERKKELAELNGNSQQLTLLLEATVVSGRNYSSLKDSLGNYKKIIVFGLDGESAIGCTEFPVALLNNMKLAFYARSLDNYCADISIERISNTEIYCNVYSIKNWERLNIKIYGMNTL